MKKNKRSTSFRYFLVVPLYILISACTTVYDLVDQSGVKKMGENIDLFLKKRNAILNLTNCVSIHRSRNYSCTFKNSQDQMLKTIDVLHLKDIDFKSYREYDEILNNEDILPNYVNDPEFEQSGRKYTRLSLREKSDCWEGQVEYSPGKLKLYSLFSSDLKEHEKKNNNQSFQYIDGNKIENFFVIYNTEKSNGCVEFNFSGN